MTVLDSVVLNASGLYYPFLTQAIQKSSPIISNHPERIFTILHNFPVGKNIPLWGVTCLPSENQWC